MAKSNELVKYLDKKVQITGKPQSGENIAVYVRPGDKIDFQSQGFNLEDAKYKLIGGDIILEFPDGGVYTFVSMALMGYNDTPPSFTIGGKDLTLSTILSEIDEINNLPLEAVLANEDVDVVPSSAEEVKELEDVTEKNTNSAPPVIITEVELDENEFDTEFEEPLDVEIPPEIPEETEPPVIAEPPADDGTPEKEDEVNDAPPLKFEFSLDMKHVLQTQSESIQGTGADASRVLTVDGGGGSYYENIYPNSNISANPSEIVKQTNQEEMSYKNTGINNYDSVLINSDNPDYFGDGYTSRTITLNPTQGAGFKIQKVWISSDDLPDGFKVHNATQSGNSWLIQRDNPDTDEIEGFTVDAQGNINIIMTMNTDVDKDFALNIKAQTVFDINNIDPEIRPDIEPPSETTHEFDLTVGVNLKKINDESDSSEYKYQEIDNDNIDLIDGQSEQTGFVISSNINDTKLYGSTTLKNTINGGISNDTIYAGNNDDTIYGNSGEDTITAYAGDDTIESGTGNDFIVSGLGDDTIDAGEGNDTIDFSHIDSVNPEGIIADLVNGTITGDGNDTISNIENVNGTQDIDIIIGDDKQNILNGNKGYDTISGGAGNDTLAGNVGNDFIEGGVGSDTVSYEDAINNVDNQGVVVTLDQDFEDGIYGTATGIDGADELKSIENVIGSNYDDTITGNASKNTISALAGDDTIYVSSNDDVIDGGTHNSKGDTIDASNSSVAHTINLKEEYILGEGYTQIKNVENATGSRGSDTIIGNDDNNTLKGGINNDTLIGNAGDDYLDGGTENDTLSGGTENDTLSGGAGDDILDGGAGDDDYADYSDEQSSISVDLSKTTSQDTKASGNDTLFRNYFQMMILF